MDTPRLEVYNANRIKVGFVDIAREGYIYKPDGKWAGHVSVFGDVLKSFYGLIQGGPEDQGTLIQIGRAYLEGWVATQVGPLNKADDIPALKGVVRPDGGVYRIPHVYSHYVKSDEVIYKFGETAYTITWDQKIFELGKWIGWITGIGSGMDSGYYDLMVAAGSALVLLL